MKQRFSQRQGLTPISKNIQLESIDIELFNGLWNVIINDILDPVFKDRSYRQYEFQKSFSSSVCRYYKLRIDEIPTLEVFIVKFIKEKFFESSWYEVYDFIEFLSSIDLYVIDSDCFIENVNQILTQEFAGYRFINRLVVPISSTVEVQTVEGAIDQTQRLTSLKGANIHLTKALNKLSDREKPDYGNSIKESISAVENACRVITGESTLGASLKKLTSRGVLLNDQLKSGFEKLYAYTNNKESGIRHAIMENHQSPDFDDAKYMIVACSSFINFLIGKCGTSNVDLQIS